MKTRPTLSHMKLSSAFALAAPAFATRPFQRRCTGLSLALPVAWGPCLAQHQHTSPLNPPGGLGRLHEYANPMSASTAIPQTTGSARSL
ncbi:hypothetical protein BKA70DRAFT_1295098 [Coprinopsis sp. MPI-PUGE-AT-0042]|nr:hypothetical protein BKA70DRAFT_1295098 [Coprinopsis sp. MPI-PUGE-AT-0042]